jgi:hypothetical protein
MGKSILSDEELKKAILKGSLELLAENRSPSQHTLRFKNIKGSKKRIIQVLDELITDGLLPPRKINFKADKKITNYPIKLEKGTKKKERQFTEECILIYGRERILKQYKKS